MMFQLSRVFSGTRLFVYSHSRVCWNCIIFL